ncbi:MAG: AmmeMemoRadiSam system radical SAM enzyme [Deltaproteobacteria bacterium]|nr:AmmeMemoRadiSam system radical SAM enzyme [Deltaproteobacteria bacterium]
MAKEAMLYEIIDNQKAHCFLCSHHCQIADSKYGICGVRQNINGKLFTHAYGKVIAANVDPIEKKPLYHFLPGSLSFSIATVGCNFRCGFCQNWEISQIPKKKTPDIPGSELSPPDIVHRAQENRCQSIAYTYTEPTIFFEYAYDTAKLAREAGLFNIFVTNGFMTAEALETINPYLDACNVDLKSFKEDFYKKTCHGHLEPVLDSIQTMKKLNIWVEVTTLVIPGENDDEDELKSIAKFIASVDPNIPWHISRFHPDYHYNSSPATPIETMKKAYSIGKNEGLNFIYLGNVPGEPAITHCQRCQELLIRREGYLMGQNLVYESRCPYCGGMVPGVFRT